MDEHDLTPFDIVMAASDRVTAEHQARIEAEEEKKYAYPRWYRKFRLMPIGRWGAILLWYKDDFENCYLKTYTLKTANK